MCNVKYLCLFSTETFNMRSLEFIAGAQFYAAFVRDQTNSIFDHFPNSKIIINGFILLSNSCNPKFTTELKLPPFDKDFAFF